MYTYLLYLASEHRSSSLPFSFHPPHRPLTIYFPPIPKSFRFLSRLSLITETNYAPAIKSLYSKPLTKLGAINVHVIPAFYPLSTESSQLNPCSLLQRHPAEVSHAASES